jgi:hypothetical protein
VTLSSHCVQDKEMEIDAVLFFLSTACIMLERGLQTTGMPSLAEYDVVDDQLLRHGPSVKN